MTYFIRKLNQTHSIDEFDCGHEALNRFLIRFALTNQQSNASVTWIALSDETVIGYYTLVVGEVHFEDAPERLSKGLATFPIPIVLLARFAVDSHWQSKGVGSSLLKDAMARCVSASEIAGIRALAVHAKDETAAAFYRHFDFIPSPTDPLHLYMLIKDLRRAINAS